MSVKALQGGSCGRFLQRRPIPDVDTFLAPPTESTWKRGHRGWGGMELYSKTNPCSSHCAPESFGKTH